MISKSLNLFAPAKLNLRLKVVGRRADGFHLLSMLNATIALNDRLTICSSSNQGLSLSVVSKQVGLDLGDVKNNLVYKAAESFLEEFKINSGLSIELEKIIPVGAGLGGGSSDAATCLLGLSQMFALNAISNHQDVFDCILEISQKLGSDVPYFVYGGLCKVSGVGEHVERLSSNPLSGRHFLLVCPDYHSSTIEVYKDFKSKKPSEELVFDSYWDQAEITYKKILDLIDNDLSISVFSRSELCLDLYNLLSKTSGVKAGLTGSGSAIFCLPIDENDLSSLRNAQRNLPRGVQSRILTFN